MSNMEKVINIGHFDIPDPHSVYLYIASVAKEHEGSKEHLDAVFQVVNILGKCLPQNTDIWVDFENPPPEGSMILMSTEGPEDMKDNAADHMQEYLGEVAKDYWHLARVVVIAFNHINRG